MYKIFLRIEGIAFFVLSIVTYFYFSFSWVLFLVLFFVPDISILAHKLKLKHSLLYYNLTHNYFFPVVVLLLSYIANNNMIFQLSLIWISHIGFDRMLGFGLKTSSFNKTHIANF